MNKKRILGAGLLAAVVFLGFGGWYGYHYMSTPEHLRNPAFEHYHFRTQIVVDGEPVDFSKDEFQQEYDASSCSIELTGTPVDFHDNVDQMTHIHWDGMTGGEFLKYYGWNFVGGDDETLGRRFDTGKMPTQSISIFGNLLPAVPENTNYYVYTGDEDGYEQKNWENFIKQDLEEFFGKKSNLSQDASTTFMDYVDSLIFPKAQAHGGEIDDHSESAEESDKTEQELTRINNLIGNVVIFVQENEPTDEDIKARFASLVPLHDSTCGG